MTSRNALLALFAFLFVTATAFARVGGGQSYSGGGSNGGGGGGDDGAGELIYLVFRVLLWLTIEHPVIGIPVDIIVVVAVIRYVKRNKKLEIFSVSSSPAAVPSAPPLVHLDALRRFDPNFSEIAFADFCYSLYARVHDARGRGALDQYAPYFSTAARNALRARNPNGLNEVRGIVIGAFRVAGVRGLDQQTVTATVAYESNYTEVVNGAQTGWYVSEQWVLERKRDILSPPPEKAKADHCPRCGAALQTRTDGACEYCGVKIESGAFQWYARAVTLVTREVRGPLLTANVPERGTDRPTIFQSRFGEHRAAFEAAHGGFDWRAFETRVNEIATELQSAWSGRDSSSSWERIRPLETDGLFQMHRYWIDAYREQRLRNIVDDFRVHRVQPVKIATDAFYESITVRIWSEGRDYTVDESGSVVAGSKRDARQWTEYWTFIRTRGAASGTQKRSCPNCGAPVAVGAIGICEFCGGKLSTGEFDWVLSRIEQDEAYR